MDYGVRSLDSLFSLSDSTESLQRSTTSLESEPPLLSSDELIHLQLSSDAESASEDEQDSPTDPAAVLPTVDPTPNDDTSPCPSTVSGTATASTPHPLSSFLLASLQSLPSSPTSSSVPVSSTGRSSVESSPPFRARGERPAFGQRGESSSTRSSSGGSSRGDNDMPELVMPSMLLPSAIASSDSGRKASSREREREGEGAEPARLLVMGRSKDEVWALARLLRDKRGQGRRDMAGDSEADLTGSYLEHHPSSARDHFEDQAGGAQDGLLEEIGTAEEALFFKINDGLESTELAKRLLVSLERIDSLINPCYPTSQGLLQLLKNGVRPQVEGCLMMFSSPPLPHEIAIARQFSLLLPIFPILILPPSPNSKPQKCGALVRAVTIQLSTAGVRFTPAFESVVEGRHCPLFVLPQALLSREYLDSDGESSAMSSLASSQELCPRSQSQSYSPLPGATGDLGRLTSLVSSPLLREKIKNNFITSFLEWREIDSAAKGVQFWRIDELPREWSEAPLDEGEKEQWGLDFSKRVAERRKVRSEQGSSIPLGQQFKEDTFFSSEAMRRSNTEMGPRATIPLDPFPPTDAPLLPTHNDHCTDFVLSQSIDPFHLPSLLHLVGLNLRLTLLPRQSDNGRQDFKAHGSRWTLIGTAAFVGFVWFTGFFCGKSGGIGGAFREVLRTGVVALVRN